VKRFRLTALLIALLASVAVLRTVQTYATTAQGFDEPCHISAALEWLDRHTYTLDPVHPPLARAAIGLPLLFTGERYPSLPPDDPGTQNYNVVGNHIIYSSGHFARTLALARSGMLPFLVLEIVLVFLWARREFGDLAGVLAAALFSTLPIVLAFAGLAYTDLPASCMQFALFFAFATWLDDPTTRSTVWLGIAAGFALLSKFTILLFFPAVAVALVLCKLPLGERSEPLPKANHRAWLSKALIAGAIAVVVLWAGYGFSVGHVRESMQLTPENMPSFQHFPGPVRSLARAMVIADPVLPRPAEGDRHRVGSQPECVAKLSARENQDRRMVVLLSGRRRRKDALAVSDLVRGGDCRSARTQARDAMAGAGPGRIHDCGPDGHYGRELRCRP